MSLVNTYPTCPWVATKDAVPEGKLNKFGYYRVNVLMLWKDTFFPRSGTFESYRSGSSEWSVLKNVPRNATVLELVTTTPPDFWMEIPDWKEALNSAANSLKQDPSPKILPSADLAPLEQERTKLVKLLVKKPAIIPTW